MQKLSTTLFLIATMVPSVASAQSESSIIPLFKGAYAPASAGCDVAAAAFIYVEDKNIGANKTAGVVRSVKRDGNSFALDVLWVEAGSDDADGDRDTVRIEVKNNKSFVFSNSTSQNIPMKWCN